MSFEPKFAIFKAEVLKTLELPDEAMAILESALKTAKFHEVETKTVTISLPSTTTVSSGTVSAPKKQSGYNLFVKKNMKEMKNFSLTADAWKTLGKDGQKVWNDNAAASNTATGAVSAAKGSKGLSGWNYYVRENSKLVKAATPTLSSQEVMKSMGASWKALGDDGKKVWNAKAKGVVAV